MKYIGAHVSISGGVRFLAALQLNDSKKDFNTRVDRHESIGKGELGTTPVCYGIEAKKNSMISIKDWHPS
ncbi:MAG: hypothetical protein RQ739_00855 [Desulfotignum sp.]|nr:hypothetical protein [Desulfotignum sp.]